VLRWQKWSLRVGFNHREGMVLHTVGYETAARGRRAPALVRRDGRPYRDPTTDHYRRTAFDIGEWGLGFMTTSLELGCDCLGEIAYLDATLHDTRGEPYTIPNAICIHEEDDAILWKHVDAGRGAEVARSRRLVVSFHVTVANYEYLVYWRSTRTATSSARCARPGSWSRRTSPRAASRRTARSSTSARTRRSTSTSSSRGSTSTSTARPTRSTHGVRGAADRPDNPHGLALVQRNTPLRTEQEGRQDYDWRSQRAWKVVNEHATNASARPSATSSSRRRDPAR
jgi:primary-amine oxidase